MRFEKASNPLARTGAVYSPPSGNTSLPSSCVLMSRRRRIVLTDCSIYSGWPSSTMSTAFLPMQKSAISSSTSGYVTFST